MPKNNGAARKAQRQGVAEASALARAQRSPQQQIEVLNKRTNGAAFNERSRLLRQVQEG